MKVSFVSELELEAITVLVMVQWKVANESEGSGTTGPGGCISPWFPERGPDSASGGSGVEATDLCPIWAGALQPEEPTRVGKQLLGIRENQQHLHLLGAERTEWLLQGPLLRLGFEQGVLSGAGLDVELRGRRQTESR